MKIYIVSSEFTIFSNYTGYEEKRTQTEVESCFKFKNAAENYIHNKIKATENMCMLDPVIHQGFVHSQWGCNWLDLCNGYSQRYFISFSIKELDLYGDII